jgi:hypothetical protein
MHKLKQYCAYSCRKGALNFENKRCISKHYIVNAMIINIVERVGGAEDKGNEQRRTRKMYEGLDKLGINMLM